MILLLFICGGFLGLGMLKMVKYPQMLAAFQSWDFPVYSMYIIGIFEILLSISIFYNPTRILALSVSIVFMIAALAVHLTHAQWDQLYGPIFTLSIIIPLLLIEIKQKSK